MSRQETKPTWKSIVGGILAKPSGQLSEDDLAALAEVCLATDTLTPEYAGTGSRPGGLPGGQPGRSLARQAASRLAAETENGDSVIARYRHVLGLIWTVERFRPSSADPLASVRGEAERRERAVVIARELGDDTLNAYCLYLRGLTQRKLTDWTAALDDLGIAAHLTMTLLEGGDRERHPGPFLATGARGSWAEPLKTQLRVMTSRAFKWSAMTRSIVGDIDRWREDTQLALEYADPLRNTRPSVLVEALVASADLARHVGDRDGFRKVEKTLRDWADQGGLNRVARGWVNVAASNATHLHDYSRAYELQRLRLDISLEDVPTAPARHSPPEAYHSVLHALNERGQHGRRLGVGNAANETALSLWRSRRTAEDTAVWHEASRWLDLAVAAWEEDGHNGLIAVSLTRARLLTDHPEAPEPLRAADMALAVSRDALLSGTRSNAAVLAANWCAPGDTRVRDLLDELIEDVTPMQAARRLPARARWYRRLAENLEEGGAASEAVDEAWHRAEHDALTAASNLEIDGVFVDAELALRSWEIAAAATSRTNTTTDDESRVLLFRLLNVVRCVAELLVTASHVTDRTRLAERYGTVFAQAADLAVRLEDTAAADLILEALRRDRVGLLITDLSQRTDINNEIRAELERILAALYATPELPPSAGPGDERQERRSLGQITEAIIVNRANSTHQADRLLGLLSAMTDGRSVSALNARQVLAEHPGTGDTAVLQLCATGTGLLGVSGSAPRLYRRLTWKDADGEIYDHLDAVALRAPLNTLSPSSNRYWQILSQLTSELLPEPLLELLRERYTDRPLRLMIIPSGLFDLAFDALPIGDDRLLIDVADTSVHTSLATMRHLIRTDCLSKPRRGNVAVYDTGTLQHTQAELDALQLFLSPVEVLTLRREIVNEFGESRGHNFRMLAMAIHGIDDENGWGQIKQLPDGTQFTAAEAIALSFPPLCVMASCYSNIRLRDNLELAGFPLSLFAGGANTVVGTLFDVDDEATSQVLQKYWRHLAKGVDAVRALRLARLEWLSDHPEHRPVPRLWAGLVVLGGSHL
ncbi:hypothetical protein HNR06_000964 [Nocardiopsis arvandica]|uniref:CHAT domain-containing protein n=1 Tax=Nocardiopsis sinuspersici TaxID=501010 RepID=A0A7Z0BIU4_9ACTN|nr:CHAT domain-containing protein [Nocardiopsis sinuspersici]NYH51375.1 hypothetical protein [Nocardiopsis sinuspersici]